jgi:hypothetical protein
MDPEKIKAALAALKAGDGDAALALLEEIIAGAPADAPPADAAALAGNAETPPPADAAALAALCQLTGAPNATEAVSRFRTMAEQVNTLAADRASFDLAERRTLIAELVRLGVEFPATAWEGDATAQKPVARLASEDLASLRQRVELHRAKAPNRGHVPPVNPGAPAKPLTKTEQAACVKLGITPEEFQARKAGAVRTASRSAAQ